MATPREIWRGMPVARRAVAIAIPVALVAGGAGAAAMLVPRVEPIVAEVVPSPVVTPAPLPPEPTLVPDPSPTPLASPTPPGADAILGVDGRLTVLLLGSDYRPAHPGNRTDAIMVVSVDPSTGQAAGFSVPRDAVGFPIPGGGKYSAKINGLYQHLQSRTGKGGESMRQAFAKAFDVEIDGYVFMGFQGVKDLVRAVGGVDVTLDRAYYDPYYWVSRTQQGWGLPKGRSHLGPNEALIFARSRKGDNDFGRARRQQLLVLAALEKARARGIARLPALLKAAKDTVRTDLPLDRAEDLFEIVATTDLSTVNRVVFGPTTYADSRGGSSFEVRLDKARNWIRRNFPVERLFAQWPAEVAAPPVPSAAP